jgi:hypothetical protein
MGAKMMPILNNWVLDSRCRSNLPFLVTSSIAPVHQFSWERPSRTRPQPYGSTSSGDRVQYCTSYLSFNQPTVRGYFGGVSRQAACSIPGSQFNGPLSGKLLQPNPLNHANHAPPPAPSTATLLLLVRSPVGKSRLGRMPGCQDGSSPFRSLFP